MAKAMHWADQVANRVIGTKGEKDAYVVASGITPSGTVHVGNFREVITVDFVARSLRRLGKKVRFIFSWDDFDTFRKVPKNLPDPKSFEKYLRIPVRRMPDPWGKAGSYADGFVKKFESEIQQTGIEVEFLYQHDQYGTGIYAEGMRQALDNTKKLQEILNRHRSTPLPESWLPTAIYCEKCGKDQMDTEKYQGDWQYFYKCSSCQHEATTDIRTTKNLKLNWRTDWPMRWAFEKVDFEPGGKDHSSEGGSFDTAKQISKEVYNWDPPVYQQYDFVMIKGQGGKISSSSGDVITVSEVLEIYSPQMLRWIFAKQKPNSDFSISFDEDVIKSHDEYDRFEAQALGPPTGGKWEAVRRTFELSLVDEKKIPEKPPFRPPFRELCTRLQLAGGDIEKTRQRYYESSVQTEVDQGSFRERSVRALNWLEKHAPEEFKYRLNDRPASVSMDQQQAAAIVALQKLISEVDLIAITPKDLNEKIYQAAIHGTGIENPKDFFRLVYQKLIGRDQGPRLPMFLKEIGKAKVLELL